MRARESAAVSNATPVQSVRIPSALWRAAARKAGPRRFAWVLRVLLLLYVETDWLPAAVETRGEELKREEAARAKVLAAGSGGDGGGEA